MNVKQLLLAKSGTALPSCAYAGGKSSDPTTHRNHVRSQYALSSLSDAAKLDAPEDIGIVEMLQDEAELLLSFANIARCEITDHPSALDESHHDRQLPMLPRLLVSCSSSDSAETVVSPDLAPRSESILRPLPHFKPLPAPGRLRTVSFDAQHYVHDGRSRTPSPVMEGNHYLAKTKTPTIVSPDIRRPTMMHRSTRQSHHARRQQAAKKVSSYHNNDDDDDDDEEMEEERVLEETSSCSEVDEEESHRRTTTSKKVIANQKQLSTTTPVSGRSSSFQAKPPSGVATTTIHRRKFSWKNYPELEQFLVANREEYLRHSALNYTIQQKQYNNRLTDRLLTMATEHGYIFAPKDFNFVTVRDRIRCFYKSYVQSAKKRGILMGYAARKAGLISEDDLLVVGDGEIIEPALL